MQSQIKNLRLSSAEVIDSFNQGSALAEIALYKNHSVAVNCVNLRK